jgi:hypothetical protein
MLANIPVYEISHSSMPEGAPVTSPTHISNIDHSLTNSILALFELAALQTPDPNLVRHIRQVITTKRAATTTRQ